jgi:hypothetical protein
VVVKPMRGKRGAPSHPARATRGLVVRRIVTDAIDPSHPEGLAEALSDHFKVELLPPARSKRSWELRVVEALT